MLESSHPPVCTIPPADIQMECLAEAAGFSFCEWKGRARYFSVVVKGRRAERAAWSYPDPVPDFAPIRNHVALFAGPMDACTVDGEQVQPQPDGFYGGWITTDIVGPFKGSPGTLGG